MLIAIIGLLLIMIGIVSWFLAINPFATLITGLVLGIVLIILVIKKLAQLAVKSLVAWTILASIISYKITSHVIKQNDDKQMVGKTRIYNDDYKDIVSTLKSQGFPSTLAKEATEYAISQVPDEPLEEKLREAFKYLGNGHKELVGKG